MAKKPRRQTCRPLPGPEFSDHWRVIFSPAPALAEWIRANLLTDGAPLYNEEHKHLTDAHIGILWTNAANVRRGQRVLGQAEVPMFRCGAWQKARQELQLVEWFGDVPDFVITLDADYCLECTDAEFCALIEHELYHCAQARDEYGLPRFNRDTGLPMFALRGHDVEEFVGVVRRYGPGAPDGALAQLVEAANSKPEVAKINIARACGTCQLKAV